MTESAHGSVRVEVDTVRAVDRRRQRAADRAHAYSGLLDAIRAGTYQRWAWPAPTSLAPSLERLRSDLVAIAGERSASAPAWGAAVGTLLDIDPTLAVDRLVEALTKAERPEPALHLITSTAPEQLRARSQLAPNGLGRADLADAVSRLIGSDDPGVAQAAAAAASALRLPTAEAALLATLRAAPPDQRLGPALDLAAVASTPEAAAAVMDAVAAATSTGFVRWIGGRLRPLLHHADPALAGPSRSAFAELLLSYRESRYDQGLVYELAAVAGPEQLPALLDVARNADDPVSRACAEVAAARLRPDREIELLTAMVAATTSLLVIPALDAALQRSRAGGIDGEALASAVAARHRHEPLDLEAAVFLDRWCGTAGEQLLAAPPAGLSASSRSWLHWRRTGFDLASAVDDLAATGVVLDRAAAGAASGSGRLPPEVLRELLLAAGFVFDVETGLRRPPHDELIEGFAAASRGLLTVDWVEQRAAADGSDRYELELLVGDTFLRTAARQLGDWYDVGAVVALVNTALVTVGAAERFMAIDLDLGQTAAYVLAEPVAFREVAARYGIARSDDHDLPMRLGILYEQYVRETYEG